MRTLRGALVGAIAVLLTTTTVAAPARAEAADPPAAPHTAFTMHFDGWGYIDGNFSYEASRNTLEIYQQNANGYALVMRGFDGSHWHDLNVTPPLGTRFTAGQSYPTRTNFSPQESITTLNVSGDGQGCSTGETGTLDVAEAEYDDETGKFTAFAASFSIPCGGTDTAKGEIRFQSSIGYKATDSWEYRLQMGRQPAGAAGTPQDVTVEVNGTEPTTFGAASLSGANPAAFEISANTCSGQTLSYGETCKLTITPKASAIGAQTAVLTLVENSIAGKVARLLSLEGFDARDATASPSYFDFGYVPAYETSAPKTVTLTGAGDVPITFGTASIVGANAAYFKITNDACSGRTLAKGQTCAITAVARPAENTQGGAVISLPDDSFAGSTQLSLGVNGYKSDKGTYSTMSPYRILDTRSGKGAPKALVGSGKVVSLQVTGAGGVPTDASTVVLNVTVTGPTGSGFVTVYPSDVARPNASSLNYVKGWTGANSVTVKVGANGKVNLYNAGASTHLVADVFGYYSKGHECCSGYDGGQYHALAKPIRLTDTRTWGSRLPADHYLNSVANWNSTINPRVRAFAVNITATSPTGSGFLTAWSGYAYGLPNTSTLNYVKGATVPNFAVVPTTPCDDCGSATGLPSIGVYTSTSTHVIVDLVGFYDDGTLPNGLRFSPAVPTRIADTRAGQGWPARLGPGQTATIAAPSPVTDADTRALATNVTAVKPTQTTFLTVWPAGIDGIGRPSTSNLNPTAGSVVPNAVQTMVGPDRRFNVYNASGYCDVVVDVVGTFYRYPPSAPADWEAGARARDAAPADPSAVTPTVPAPERAKQL
ncbi:choice-of-anchor D domain-containing protein [Micromonospora sp. S4605]|uniref:choice-of-anchor D domain-containing protein n=1 Tax=Micromonospora sp. S4605 TaxID=1420897 RepID=UPI0011B6E16D|nr:choice-of-anchor D domain-containing protein [Micromonospora sp. S4605]